MWAVKVMSGPMSRAWVENNRLSEAYAPLKTKEQFKLDSIKRHYCNTPNNKATRREQ